MHGHDGWTVLFIISGCVALYLVTIISRLFEFVTVMEWQTGLLFTRGKLEKTLPSGRYRVRKQIQSVKLIDMRSVITSAINQEIVCADNLTLRISVQAVYKVVDAALSVTCATSYVEQIHLHMQAILRELVMPLKLEEVMAKRNELSMQFGAQLIERTNRLGIEVESGGIRDIAFPPDVKKMLSQIAQAEKAGQASLARARGETASLRALANASKLMDDHPSLLALRTLQQLAESQGSGNTIVLALPGALSAVSSIAPTAPAATDPKAQA